MNTKPATNWKKDGIITAIGVLVLLLGGATGNAIVMLAMSILGFAVIAIIDRQRLGRVSLVVMLVASATAAVLGFAFALF